jgi:hypothetical protein
MPNPLQQSEIEVEQEDASSPDESNPVKVSQTDVAPDVASFPNLNPNLNLPPPDEASDSQNLQRLPDLTEKCR